VPPTPCQRATALTADPVPRMQFYAIEIARNRSGLNDWIYENNQKEQAEAKAAKAKKDGEKS
jgi:hypothetical protein